MATHLMTASGGSFEMETTAKVIGWRYLIVVENDILWRGQVIHGLEHYVEVEVDTNELQSRAPHLHQHWLPLDRLTDFDLRPTAVRDAILRGELRAIRHIAV
jgi:hypothetical protein